MLNINHETRKNTTQMLRKCFEKKRQDILHDVYGEVLEKAENE